MTSVDLSPNSRQCDLRNRKHWRSNHGNDQPLIRVHIGRAVVKLCSLRLFSPIRSEDNQDDEESNNRSDGLADICQTSRADAEAVDVFESGRLFRSKFFLVDIKIEGFDSHPREGREKGIQ